MKIIVTGGAGFIGSEFVRQAVKQGYKVAVVDKLTYASDLQRLKEVKGKFKFYKTDICNQKRIASIFSEEKPEVVFNFAAETHVDKSIRNASPFIDTNVKGTQILLDVSRENKIKKFIHISTDEVYGEITQGQFSEIYPLKPSSPYAASKAAADLLIKAYIRTYGFPGIIARPCNNYGHWQYPEKLIPLVILKALKNQKIPIYGKGQNMREWLYVSDCIEAVLLILQKGRLGEIYNIGSSQEKKNIDIVRQILGILGKSQELIEFVEDRPGHDFRYFLNSEKIRSELCWNPKIRFDEGIKYTVQWYINNKKWLDTLYR